MSTSGDVESISNSLPKSAPGSAPGSPRNKVKFLCSHGGKILPRPSDGHLKYVGGETRVISVPRNIIFNDLMRKLSSLLEGDVILKYQLIPEDLDALVTVKSDEDLRHMFEEYDRQELINGTPRLRTFLFPANPIVVIDNQIVGPTDRHSLEQRYINSINGIIVNQTVPPPPPIYNNNFRPPAINTSPTTFTISSSACSSPRTPPETAIPTIVASDDVTGFRKHTNSMTRAHSSPSLCNLAGNPQSNHKNHSPRSTLNLSLTNQLQYPYHHQTYRQPPPPPPPQPYHPHSHPHPHPHTHHLPHLSPKPPLNPGPEQYLRQRTSGVPEYYRYATEHNQHSSPHTSSNPYGRSSRGSHMGSNYNNQIRGGGSSIQYDEYNNNNGNVIGGRYLDRESPPGSPLARSPHQNNNVYVPKWDSVGGRN